MKIIHSTASEILKFCDKFNIYPSGGPLKAMNYTRSLDTHKSALENIYTLLLLL